jgi:signal transduction histidine kinase
VRHQAHHLSRARTAALVGTTAQDVPVLDVAREVAAALRRLFADRDLAIAVAGDATLRARCERQDLSEMLGNLMENACKWAAAEVTVTVAAATHLVRVEVSDDGPGLPAEHIPRALERGVQLDEAAPGSGLGLAIVADLAALYGGALDLGTAGPRVARHSFAAGGPAAMIVMRRFPQFQ